MATSPTLLTMPPEIRDQIWFLAFGNLHISPHEEAYALKSDCAACQSIESKQPDITSLITAITPLLTCRQIYNEARAVIHETLTLHISTSSALADLSMPNTKWSHLIKSVRRLTLYTHLDAESRFDWFAELISLSTIFPALEKFTLYSHMRPPKDYDCLVDAAYLLGPLIHLPAPVRPSPERAKIAMSDQEQRPVDKNFKHHMPQSASQLPVPQEQADSNAESLYASTDLNPNCTIHFDYSVSEMLFDSPFIGAIMTSDAIEEHEAVLRDCLADAEFRMQAEQRDLNGMTLSLLDIAREHEQIWLEGLHRRRRGNDFMDVEIIGEVDGGGEWGVDPGASDMSESGSTGVGSPLSHTH